MPLCWLPTLAVVGTGIICRMSHCYHPKTSLLISKPAVPSFSAFLAGHRERCRAEEISSSKNIEAGL